MSPSVLTLGSESADAVVDVLSEAFFDYPVMRAVLGERGDDYPADLRTLVGFFVKARALRTETLLGIGTPRDLDAAAIVSRPGEASPPELDAVRTRVWGQLGEQARERYASFGAAWSMFRVDEPHIHLNMIGARRRARGRGLARILLDHVHGLSERDPDSYGVTLSTENPANVSLYQHFGYRVIGHAALAGGVETWGFYRPDTEKQWNTEPAPHG